MMIKCIGMSTLFSLLLWSATITTAAAILSPDTVDDDCMDTKDKCAIWAQQGDCRERPVRMLWDCPKSCNICDLRNRTTDFGFRQECKGRESSKVASVLRESILYMNSDKVMDMDAGDFLQCVNYHESCSHWKVWGGTYNQSIHVVFF
jgi:hypothetical protein